MKHNILNLVEIEKANGYNEPNAIAKVCQDIILMALSMGCLSKNVTIKGGVVMRSKTNNVRRATQDIDIDFIRYSLDDNALNSFIEILNCMPEFKITIVGKINELKQQDYKGKRIHIQIEDVEGSKVTSKIDIGVHTKLEINQEEYCFDIAFNQSGVNLLINSNEQVFTEKLKSLLRLGVFSTRYKDVFDMAFLADNIDNDKLIKCFEVLIFEDNTMRENEVIDIFKRIRQIFSNTRFKNNLVKYDKKWIDHDVDSVCSKIMNRLDNVVEVA